MIDHAPYIAAVAQALKEGGFTVVEHTTEDEEDREGTIVVTSPDVAYVIGTGAQVCLTWNELHGWDTLRRDDSSEEWDRWDEDSRPVQTLAIVADPATVCATLRRVLVEMSGRGPGVDEQLAVYAT